jgi:hypothetical protein
MRQGGTSIGIAAALALAMWTGCGAPAAPRTPPSARIGSAEAAIAAAVRAGAERDPQALRHLRIAQRELARARALVRDGEYVEAEALLTRAEADGDAAETLARHATRPQAQAQALPDRESD